MRKYEFTKNGINKMYGDCLDTILATLDGRNADSTIEELNIRIAIGDAEIIVPTDADSFDALFTYLDRVEEENR